MGFFSSEPQPPIPTTATRRNTVTLGPESQALINTAIPRIQQFAASPPVVPDLPGFNATQVEGRNAVLGAARGAQQNIANQGAGAFQFLTDPGIVSPESNPYLRATAEGAADVVTTNFQRNVLPSLRSGANAAGQFGGSREGVAQAISADDLNRTVANQSANIFSTGYGQGLNALSTGLSLAPTAQNIQTTPGATIEAVGAQERDLEIAQQERDLVNQYLPFLASQDVIRTATGIPGQTSGVSETTATTPAPEKPSVFQAGLGGAATGASIGATMGPMGAGIGAALGAVAGVLMR